VAGAARGRGRLILSMGWPFLGRVAFAASGLAIGVMTARLLGPADRGLFTLCVLAGAFAALLPRAITYALAFQLTRVAREGGDAHRERGVVRDGWRFVAVTTGAMLLVWLPLAVVVAGEARVAIAALTIVAASIIVGGPIGLTRGVALAQERMGRWAFAYTSYQIGALVGVAVAVPIAGTSLPAIASGWSIGALVGGLAGIAWTDYAVLRSSATAGTVRAQSAFAAKDSLTGFLSTAAGRVDILMMGILSGPAGVGIYSVAVGASELISFLPSALQSSTYARIGSLDPAGARALTQRIAVASMGIAVAQAVLLAVIAHPLVIFLFGDAFAQSADFLLILLIAVILDCGRTAYSAYFLNSLGRPTLPLACSVVDLVCTALVCLLLIPSLGGYGAAVGAAAGYGAALGAAVLLMRWASRRDSPAP
jgi:PST family polysaccharide transporter